MFQNHASYPHIFAMLPIATCGQVIHCPVFPLATHSVQRNQQGANQEVIIFNQPSILVTEMVKLDPCYELA